MSAAAQSNQTNISVEIARLWKSASAGIWVQIEKVTMGKTTDQLAMKDGIGRRALLSVTMALPFLAATTQAFAQSQSSTSAIDVDGLHQLSVAVIGPRANDHLLAAAYHAAFAEIQPDFLKRAASLAAAMKAAGLSTPDAFSSSALVQDPVQHATAIALTAAWYLGHVEDDDHGQPVAYEKALMWGPTSDIMVIPSYARGGPDYWAHQESQIKRG